MGFAGFTANKTLADHITAFFALAPVTTVKDVKGLFAAVEYVYKPLEVSYLTDHLWDADTGIAKGFSYIIGKEYIDYS